jgi:DNA-directed RNA polymerase subunit RPC12/RpoP
MKFCPKCKTKKTSDYFFKSDKYKDGLSSYCKECSKDYTMEYYRIHKSKIQERVKINAFLNKKKIKKQRKDYRLKHIEEIKTKKQKEYYFKKYGITIQEKEAMLKKCSYKCKVCKKKVDLQSGKIDHNHTTGAIRGILCNSCNNRIIGVLESSLLEKGFEYLRKYKIKE